MLASAQEAKLWGSLMVSMADDLSWIDDQLVQFLGHRTLYCVMHADPWNKQRAFCSYAQSVINNIHSVDLMGDKFIYTTME